MAENLDILNAAVSLLIRAALLAARFSGRVRKRSLKRLAGEDVDAKPRRFSYSKTESTSLKCRSRSCRNTSARRARVRGTMSVRGCSSSGTWKPSRSPGERSPGISASPDPRSITGCTRSKTRHPAAVQ